MLRDILDKQYHRNPHPFLGKIPNQFNPTFMKALQNDAEMDGMVDQANALILDQKQKNEVLHEKALDETWGAGILAGFDEGLEKGKIYGHNTGLIDGLLAGWSDAASFKNPHRVYDLANPSTKPIAEGISAEDLADKIPDTPENRLWRRKTDHMAKKSAGFALSNWNKIKNDPFAYHQDHDRLGLNLNQFIIAGQNTDPIQGTNAKTAGGGQTTIKKVIKSKKDLVAEALGKVIEQPTRPKNFPDRPNQKPPQTPQVEDYDISQAEEVFDPPENTFDPDIDALLREIDPKPATPEVAQKAIIISPMKHKRRGQTPDQKRDKNWIQR